MRDLHDPNNPDYEKESDLTREIIFEKLTNEEINFLQEEEDDYRNTISKYMMRMGKVKLELKELIEVLEQTEQTYTLNKLKSIWEI